jgi:tetratricopeptide (TPR) repeat protein
MCLSTATAQESATVNLDSVDDCIGKQGFFDTQKEHKIMDINMQIAENKNDTLALYVLLSKKFEEYRSYVYDSAYVCAERLLDIANALNDKDKIISSTTKIGYCYFSSGLFKEAFEVLSLLDANDCSDSTKIEYYICKSIFYYNLADYNNSEKFRKKYNNEGNEIIDKAIALFPEGSVGYWNAVGLRRMKSDDTEGALVAYQKMLAGPDCSEHDVAVATSSIAYLFSLQGDKQKQKQFLMMAAIADIKSSTKETVALRNLAGLLYEEGDIVHATAYIHHALEDAMLFNTRQRQLEAGTILPIIERERINMVEKQRNTVIWVSISIALLAILLIVAIFWLWKIMKRLSLAKKLGQETNERLSEANKIKEEYIGYFFSQNSEFIEKLGTLEKWVTGKVKARAYDELQNFPKNLNIHRERENMYERFDRIFLKLFPDFVNEFNKLLKPDQQIKLQSGELLNTDLRIYALMRLGIHENEKIAAFLDYSINTIYAYKSKIKSKSLYPNEELKEKLMEIK